VASEPEALVAFLRGLGVAIIRVGLEAGPLSQWLYDGLHKAGFETVLLETSHVKAALSARIPEQNGGRAERHLGLLAIGHFRLSAASGLPVFCVRLHSGLALAQGLATAASRGPELRTVPRPRFETTGCAYSGGQG
jgi:hypothetical protein